ncbi:TM2 domain-containing protein [Actinomyces slackii]|nr:TM2 domain-containing protein [Actinomyces slackii]
MVSPVGPSDPQSAQQPPQSGPDAAQPSPQGGYTSPASGAYPQGGYTSPASGAYPQGDYAAQAGYGYQEAGYQSGYQAGYQAAPQAAYGYGQPSYAYKSKVAAGVLGIFLGGFGIHNFYLGYTGKAVAQLLITLLTCGFGAIVSSVWGLVEGILILCAQPGESPWGVDAQGLPLRD